MDVEREALADHRGSELNESARAAACQDVEIRVIYAPSRYRTASFQAGYSWVAWLACQTDLQRLSICITPPCSCVIAPLPLQNHRAQLANCLDGVSNLLRPCVVEFQRDFHRLALVQ